MLLYTTMYMLVLFGNLHYIRDNPVDFIWNTRNQTKRM